MNWVDANSEINPPIGRPLILYCPNYCERYYMIGFFNGSDFKSEFHEDSITQYVIQWSIFPKVD